MAETFKALRVTDRVYWVGAIDWNVRNFHGYLTQRGSTYNAYLVLADKVTLVDTVKAPFFDEMMARIASVVDPQKIEVIISNHAEMDHSGSLPRTIQALKPTAVYASKSGVNALEAHFHTDGKITSVADGQQLDLGDETVTFAETKMCHWPDSMVSYLHKDQLLFSQDGFGMHLATAELFADEVTPSVLQYEARKYYANILLPLSKFVIRMLDKLETLNLPLQILAPDHGPIYRRQEDIQWILGAYRCWATQEPTRRAVVVYDTMWGSTGRMAHLIQEGLTQEGAEAKVMPIAGCHRSDIATELLQAGALIVGSPTINNVMFPTVADVLTYIRGLRPKNMVAAAFGSFGWGGEAVKQVHDILVDMGLEVIGDGLKVKYVPDESALDKCRQLGADVARQMATKTAQHA